MYNIWTWTASIRPTNSENFSWSTDCNHHFFNWVSDEVFTCVLISCYVEKYVHLTQNHAYGAEISQYWRQMGWLKKQQLLFLGSHLLCGICSVRGTESGLPTLSPVLLFRQLTWIWVSQKYKWQQSTVLLHGSSLTLSISHHYAWHWELMVKVMTTIYCLLSVSCMSAYRI